MDQETVRVVLAAAASLLVGLLGFGSAMVVLFRTLRTQERLDVLKDARALRDARRERLRWCCEKILRGLLVLHDGTAGSNPAHSQALNDIRDAETVLTLERHIEVARQVRMVVEAFAELEHVEASHSSSGQDRSEAHALWRDREEMLTKRMQADLRLMEQPVSRLDQHFTGHIAVDPEAVPEIVDSAKGR